MRLFGGDVMGYTRADALFVPGIGEMPGRASSFIGAGVGGVLVTLPQGAPGGPSVSQKEFCRVWGALGCTKNKVVP